MNTAYRVALFCGAFPLFVGISIFVLWLITRWEWLADAGVYTIQGGVLIFWIGAVALASFCWLAYQTPNYPRRRLWQSTLACAGLLLSNFLVAGAIMFAVLLLHHAEIQYGVTVHNGSQQSLESVRVFGGGCDESSGTIPPATAVTRSFRFQCDGDLKFSALSGTTKYAETINDYVTSGMGGYTTVTINPDGTILVSNDYD